MNINLVAISLVAATTLSGCASTISAWKNRGVAAHTLRPDRFFSLTGERRLAFQVERYDPHNPPKPKWDSRNKRFVGRVAWCAESLPEVSQAVTTSSKANIEVPKTKLGAEDAFATTLVATFNRTEIAELYRQMAWQSCQAWAQGVLSDDQYREQLGDIIKTGSGVIMARALQPLNPDVAKAQAEAAAAVKKKEEADKAQAAKKAACAANPTKACVEAL
jgi:cell division septation protein DedD